MVEGLAQSHPRKLRDSNKRCRKKSVLHPSKRELHSAEFYDSDHSWMVGTPRFDTCPRQPTSAHVLLFHIEFPFLWVYGIRCRCSCMLSCEANIPHSTTNHIFNQPIKPCFESCSGSHELRRAPKIKSQQWSHHQDATCHQLWSLEISSCCLVAATLERRTQALWQLMVADVEYEKNCIILILDTFGYSLQSLNTQSVTNDCNECNWVFLKIGYYEFIICCTVRRLKTGPKCI